MMGKENEGNEEWSEDWGVNGLEERKKKCPNQ
jgi:hypothetical protein